MIPNFLFGTPDREYSLFASERKAGFFQRKPHQLNMRNKIMSNPQFPYLPNMARPNLLFSTLLKRDYDPFRREDSFFQRSFTQLGRMMNSSRHQYGTGVIRPNFLFGMINSLPLSYLRTSMLVGGPAQRGHSFDIEDLQKEGPHVEDLHVEDLHVEAPHVKRKVLKIALSLTLIMTLIVFVRKKWNALPHPSLEIAKKVESLVSRLKPSGELYYRKWGFGTGYLKPQND